MPVIVSSFKLQVSTSYKYQVVEGPDHYSIKFQVVEGPGIESVFVDQVLLGL